MVGGLWSAGVYPGHADELLAPLDPELRCVVIEGHGHGRTHPVSRSLASEGAMAYRWEDEGVSFDRPGCPLVRAPHPPQVATKIAHMVCHTCALTARRDNGNSPPWDSIVRVGGWDVAHAYDTSVVGWLVLVLRRHVESLADLTVDEATALGPLIRDVSAALVATTDCTKTYVAQFAEHPDHPHVHVHVIARPRDLAEADVGPAIFNRLGVPEADRVADDDMNTLAQALRAILQLDKR